MYIESDGNISKAKIFDLIKRSVDNKDLKKVLILPPDYTRKYSYAGEITAMYYDILKDTCQVDIMPALGTHEPMTREQAEAFFGKKIPYDKLIVHNWKTDVKKIGEIPADFVKSVSDGLVEEKIDVQVNKRLLDKSYDLIVSIGQVVPHEVVGMANYSKNIFVGCGGNSMINSSHMLGAFYGLERIMGRDFSPVRKVLDYAEENFIKDIPLLYVLTVTSNDEEGNTLVHGVYIGKERRSFEMAVSKSQRMNITKLKHPIKKAVVYLEPEEFRSTWLGNKAVYRTRMAMKTGGELIVLTPAVNKFGEDKENDRLIRKYGYAGRKRVLELVKTEEDLKNNLSVAAHLIHGSSDGEFSVTYCTKYLSKEEVESVGFDYMPYEDAVKLYNPKELKDGFNTVNGEEIYYISNPALGLWKSEE
ncbi:MAG: DUF2088 domain-containing protein [Clostridia bacterium]|nr:DUF2088 domain-containing protein [Clostridia bacterium]